MIKIFSLEGLDCAGCAAEIERAVSEIEGVESAEVSVITSKLTVEADITDENALASEVAKAVAKTLPDVKATPV